MSPTSLGLFRTACFLGLSSLACIAQQPPSTNNQPVPTIQATTREVILDVVVTTKDNRPVSGLTKDDFAIEEDKTTQTIQSFESVSVTSRAVPQQKPETILLVDQMNTKFPDFAFLRYAMKKLLARNGGQLAQPTTLMALTDKGLKVLAGPTQDGKLLESAMEHLPTALPWRLELRNFYNATDRINLSLGALADIAMANAGSGTRKNIVWISPGFPIFSGAQIDARSQQSLFDAIRSLSDLLLKARIAIYTVDPRGVFGEELYSNNQQFGAYLASLEASSQVAFGDLALQTLAIQTGGRALYGRNDVDQEIADSIGDGDTYYTLSYSPANRNFDGKFRKIRILLPHNAALRARTRDGYYALPEAPAPTGKLVRAQIGAALMSPLTFNAIPIVSTATTVVRDPPRAEVKFVVDVSSFSWSPLPDGRQQANMEIAVVDFSRKDKAQHAVTRSYTATIHSEQPKAHENQRIVFHIDAPVTLPAGHLRLLIRDETTGHMGTADIANLPPAQKQEPSDYLQHRDP
jgi:VWFA-related protein